MRPGSREDDAEHREEHDGDRDGGDQRWQRSPELPRTPDHDYPPDSSGTLKELTPCVRYRVGPDASVSCEVPLARSDAQRLPRLGRLTPDLSDTATQGNGLYLNTQADERVPVSLSLRSGPSGRL